MTTARVGADPDRAGAGRLPGDPSLRVRFHALSARAVDEFLTYWLAAYVADLRPTTARGYEAAVRLHLIPGLGGQRPDKLTVQDVRAFMTACRQKCLCCAGKLDQHRAIGKRCCSVGECCKRLPSTRQVQFIHAVLRNALGQAMREELINRNVATLVRVPALDTRWVRV